MAARSVSVSSRSDRSYSSRSYSRSPVKRRYYSRSRSRSYSRSSRSSFRSSSRSRSRSYSRSRSRSIQRHDRHRSPSPIKSRLRVSPLTPNVTLAHLKEIFSFYGPVKQVILPHSHKAWLPHRGFAFIEFEKQEECENAIKCMHQGQLDGQVLTVTLAKPKPMRMGQRNGNEQYRPVNRRLSPRRRSRSPMGFRQRSPLKSRRSPSPPPRFQRFQRPRSPSPKYIRKQSIRGYSPPPFRR